MSDIIESTAGEIPAEIKSTLVLKNITVNGKRTSIRLEPEMWSELKNIAKREQCTIHDICSLITMRKHENTSLTAAIRVFLMLYFRAAATENGHDRAGHGSFENMKRRAGMAPDWSTLNRKQAVEQDAIEKRLAPHLIPSEVKSQDKSRKSV